MIRKHALLSTALLVCSSFFGAVAPVANLSAQGIEEKGAPGERIATMPGTRETTDAIMQRQAVAPPPQLRPRHEFEYPDRSHLPQSPGAPTVAQYPYAAGTFGHSSSSSIHTTLNAFDGPTLTDTSAFPPDTMGAVGPTQFIVFVNGRIRSFTKAGAADGVLNADPDVFFASVMTPPVGSNFTSDPQIRYDRFTARWYMSIIDVPGGSGSIPNRWLLAVSDAASNGTISASTVWTFFFASTDATNFCDYPSLGVDINALYFGCNMFNSSGSFVNTNGYVVQKTSVLGAGPIVVTKFANLLNGSFVGPYAPRGVDNVDASATDGYFVGVDGAAFSAVDFRRVINPGSGAPTLGANVVVTVPTTYYPNPVNHLGNTGGTNGRLDALDDRLFAATVRNGHLWTAHSILTNSAGTGTSTGTRDSTRWYEFQNLSTTPTLVQSGTIFDNAASNPLNYWIPSITVTGQGHAVVGFSEAGAAKGATPAYTGRLSGDTLGTMNAVVDFGTTTHNYNPPSDPGGTSGRRWGDYSFTVVDPLDDMSVWTIQEYNQALNSYAVRIGHLQAPPPATPVCATTPITFAAGTADVVISATSSGGSGFYDPGANLPAPALPFTHLSATVSGGVVNSATYNSPTQVTLNVTATTPGSHDVTITNPDGQSVTATSCLNIPAPPATKLAFTVEPNASYAANGTITVAVSVEDASSNVVTTDNSQIALTLQGGNPLATLGGTTTLNAVNGVASFSVSVDLLGAAYTLHAADGALTPDDSSAFNVTAGLPAAISFTQQPSDAIAGAANNPAIVVTVTDGVNPVAGEFVTLYVATGPTPAFTSITNPQPTDANGNATFADAVLTVAGAYTLGAKDGLLNALSNSFNVGPAAPQLVFTTQPTDVSQGSALNTIAVTKQDIYGNVYSTDVDQIDFGVPSCGGFVLGSANLDGSTGTATLSSTQRFYTVTGSQHVIAADVAAAVSAPSNTFAVNALADFLFADGFDGCRP